MTGYMNREALALTVSTGKVTFWSRSRKELWTKGETSGNYLTLQGLYADCDNDAVLVLAIPEGPTCHLGTESCYGDARPASGFIADLDRIVKGRRSADHDGSYTRSLFDAGTKRIAQKVGEEGVETALAAIASEDEEFLGEAADLIYHLLVLLHSRGLALEDVSAVLKHRHLSN